MGRAWLLQWLSASAEPMHWDWRTGSSRTWTAGLSVSSRHANPLVPLWASNHKVEEQSETEWLTKENKAGAGSLLRSWWWFSLASWFVPASNAAIGLQGHQSVAVPLWVSLSEKTRNVCITYAMRIHKGIDLIAVYAGKIASSLHWVLVILNRNLL